MNYQTTVPMFYWKWLSLGWLAGCVFLTGCGLSAYEAKMQRAQQRLKAIEEENRILDGPLSIPVPAAKEGVPPPPAVFLRAPKGISEIAQNATEPRNGVLYTYRNPGGMTVGSVAQVEVGIGGKDDKEFLASVERLYGRSGDVLKRPTPFKYAGRSFEATEFEDGQTFHSINHFQGPDGQVAIVYSVPVAQKAAAQKAIELSLRSFAMGADANRQRNLMGQSPLRVPGHPQ